MPARVASPYREPMLVPRLGAHPDDRGTAFAVYSRGEAVELPHTAVELPMSYFDETSYHRPFTYQRVIPWEDRFEGKEVALVFEGAMADTQVWVNGQEVIRHRDGYTPFVARLTGHLRRGDNLVTVRIDGSENPEIPPFGGQIDYLTYAGIYREVSLRVTAAAKPNSDNIWRT